MNDFENKISSVETEETGLKEPDEVERVKINQDVAIEEKPPESSGTRLQRIKTAIIRNEGKIKTAGLIALGVVAGVLLKDNVRFKKENELLDEECEHAADRIVDLKNLYEEKDSWMDDVAADALRHGSSLGGQVLADKRWHCKDSSN
ncbi:MAG: hypothetical protein Q4C41_00710 [Eggerthellaceae bacterium]|nr:hypothetical protein [Eggerthellaceae bacterium]